MCVCSLPSIHTYTSILQEKNYFLNSETSFLILPTPKLLSLSTLKLLFVIQLHDLGTETIQTNICFASYSQFLLIEDDWRTWEQRRDLCLILFFLLLFCLLFLKHHSDNVPSSWRWQAVPLTAGESILQFLIPLEPVLYCSLKTQQMNKQAKHNQRHWNWEQADSDQRGEEREL